MSTTGNSEQKSAPISITINWNVLSTLFAFSVMYNQVIDFGKALYYPLTVVLLALVLPHGTSHLNMKSDFKNIIYNFITFMKSEIYQILRNMLHVSDVKFTLEWNFSPGWDFFEIYISFTLSCNWKFPPMGEMKDLTFLHDILNVFIL